MERTGSGSSRREHDVDDRAEPIEAAADRGDAVEAAGRRVPQSPAGDDRAVRAEPCVDRHDEALRVLASTGC